MDIEQLTELQALWDRLMGTPPGIDQFIVWGEEHDFALIRHAIIKTAGKNLMMQRQMSDDHRLRYASSVMNNWYVTRQPLPRSESR